MQRAVERSAVRAAAWSMVMFSAAYLGLAILSGEWAWWLTFGELAALTVIAFAQLKTNRVSLPILWVMVVGATVITTPFLTDPHRTGVGMAVAAIAAVGWILKPEHRQRLVAVAMATMWASQILVPASRGWFMAYEGTIFVVLAIGLRSIGSAMAMSRDRYQRLFEEAPIGLWEEDFSLVDRWLHGLRRIGIQDLRAYLDSRPEELDKALGLVEVVNVNAAAAELIEVEDASGLLGSIDPTTYTAETRPAFVEQLLAVWTGRSHMATELMGQTVNGRPIQAILRWAAPPGPHGMADYSRVVISIHDVSELKTAQRDLAETNEALIAREQMLRTAVSGAPVILFAMDADGVFTLVQGSGLENLGESPDDIVGLSCFERYADRPDILEGFEKALAGEAVIAVSESKGLVWEDRFRPILDADGSVVGVIGVSTDVSARYEMERALEGARRRNRLIVRNVSDLLFSIDKNGRVGFVSPSANAILGRTPADIVGKTVAEMIHPDDVEQVLVASAEVPPGESTASIPYRIRKGDDTWLPMEARAANLLDDPELEAWVVTARDVTEQIESRRQLEAARDAAEAATRAKSELLANVSHEIRTPMNAILGMTGLSLATDVTEEQREYLTTVLSSAESLLTIINVLLDLARAEAGRFVLDEVPFSLRNTLDDVARTMRVRADEKGIGLEVRVAPDVPDWVAGDPGRLRQVVMNLVGNAVKFTDEGRVTVTAERSEDDLLRFEVADTGIGIGAEHVDSIFGAFEQADGSMTRRHGGTGLGLAISSKLVEAMGGAIGVESTVGEGSTFSFTARLPTTTALTAVGGAGMAGGPVLVVAEWPARERLMEMAEAAGYETVGAASSAEAQTAAASLVVEGRRVSALIVDFAEPDLDYCCRLASSEMLSGAPLIAIVGTGRRGDGARFRAAGVRAYLTRPLGESDVSEALAAIASGAAAEGILITRHWLRERRRPLQVLLADDSPTNRMLAVRILEKRGHHVVEVVDGIEATKAAADQDFDAVLMDVQMPGMDGLDATRLIRDRETEVGADRVPIIALTAHAMESDRQRCLAAGMDGYLAKPFSPDDLVAVVEDAASIGAITMRTGGHEAGAFGASYPTLIDRLEDAVAAGRMAEAAALSRTLAVGLGRIGAAEAASAAGHLAETGAGDPDALAGDFAKLAATLDRVEPQLGALIGE